MAGQYTTISRKEFEEVLPEGFVEVKLPKTTEVVYSKLVGKGLCIRVFSSIVVGQTRGVGEDAIRVCLVARNKKGEVRGVGHSKRINRIAPSESNPEGWRKALRERINRWEALKSPPCPICNGPMATRKGKNGKFWGCIEYPECKGTANIPS